jgi:hypothetical protein
MVFLVLPITEPGIALCWYGTRYPLPGPCCLTGVFVSVLKSTMNYQIRPDVRWLISGIMTGKVVAFSHIPVVSGILNA